MSYQKKFIIMAVAWAVSVAVLAGFLLPWFIARQEAAKTRAVAARKALAEYKAEQDNLRKAEESFNFVRSQPIQPENLLPSEASLVDELSTWEGWAKASDLVLQVKLSGSVAAAKKADTRSNTAMVPLILEVGGQPTKIVSFLKALEQATLPFVTDRFIASADGGTTGNVRITMEGNIFIKR